MNLVVGGSGFIGSWVAEKLVSSGEEVRVLDRNPKPVFLSSDIEYLRGDACDPEDMKAALQGVDTVFLLSGRTGAGESINHPQKFYRDNVRPAKLLNRLHEDHAEIDKLVVASTSRVYGEGKYQCAECGFRFPGARKKYRLGEGKWNHVCKCGEELSPIPVAEDDPVNPRTPYSRSKLDMEYRLRDGFADSVDLTLLRYPLVYGPRQGGAQDYFFSSISKGNSPEIYEDGRQLRNFMYVEDIAEATIKSAQNRSRTLYNIGRESSMSLNRFIDTVADISEENVEAAVTGDFREHDIRHSVMDTEEFQSDYSLSMTSVERAIRRTLEHYRK